MAVRVDHQGYLIDHRGFRLSAAEGNDPASVQRRWDRILADWQKTHGRNGEGPPPGTTIMEVRRGDCQWTIAEGAGADPVTTYQQLNDQFENPHLIHEGDIVFVDRSTTLAVSTDHNGQYVDNIDMFRDQQQGLAASGASPNDLEADASTFFASVPEDQRDETFMRLFEDNGRDDPLDSTTQQGIVEAYLSSFPLSQQEVKLQNLRNQYNPSNLTNTGSGVVDGVMRESYDGYNTAIDTAAQNLGLSAPETEPVTAAPTDAINFPGLVRINDAAAASGGNPTDEALAAEIASYVYWNNLSAEHGANNLNILMNTDFGAYDDQVKGIAVQQLLEFLGSDADSVGPDYQNNIQLYLAALPERDTRQNVLNELIESVEAGSNARAVLDSIAETMGLTDDVFGNPVNDPFAAFHAPPDNTPPTATNHFQALLRINNAAVNAGGNPEDAALAAEITSFVNWEHLEPDAAAQNLEILMNADFGPHGDVVKSLAVQQLTQELITTIDGFGFNVGDRLPEYLQPYLEALPEKDMQQAVLDDLLRHEYRVDNDTKQSLEDLAHEMGLEADVSWWTGNVTF